MLNRDEVDSSEKQEIIQSLLSCSPYVKDVKQVNHRSYDLLVICVYPDGFMYENLADRFQAASPYIERIGFHDFYELTDHLPEDDGKDEESIQTVGDEFDR